MSKPTNAVSNETVNRWIHEVLMGKCCVCQLYLEAAPHLAHCVPFGSVPDYCSSDSPRRLLEEAVAKCDLRKFGEALALELYSAGLMPEQADDFQALIIAVGVGGRATAEQIAHTIYQAGQEK